MGIKSNYTKTGRYGYGGSSVDYGQRLGWWERTVFEKSPSDISLNITPRYSQRPDLIAYDMYGQSGLAWLVLQFNNIINVDEELVTGVTITLPSKSRALTEIINKRKPAIAAE